MPNRTHAQPDGASSRALHETVADRIRQAILDGDLPPGARLVEDRLARENEVSRHPVREALRTLQAEGLVDISPRRGASVATVSRREAAELFDMLVTLAGLAARLACSPRRADAIVEIAELLDEAEAITADGPTAAGLERLAELNHRFHGLIATAGGNQHLIDTTARLRDRLQSAQSAVARRRPELSWAEHREIFTAITAHDPAGAEHLARAHASSAKTAYVDEPPNGRE